MFTGRIEFWQAFPTISIFPQNPYSSKERRLLMACSRSAVSAPLSRDKASHSSNVQFFAVHESKTQKATPACLLKGFQHSGAASSWMILSAFRYCSHFTNGNKNSSSTGMYPLPPSPTCFRWNGIPKYFMVSFYFSTEMPSVYLISLLFGSLPFLRNLRDTFWILFCFSFIWTGTWIAPAWFGYGSSWFAQLIQLMARRYWIYSPMVIERSPAFFINLYFFLYQVHRKAMLLPGV